MIFFSLNPIWLTLVSGAVNPFDAEIGKFWEDKITTMAADDLVHCVARTSTAILTMQNKERLVFQAEVFSTTCSISLFRNDKRCKIHYVFQTKLSMLTLNVRGPSYLGLTRSISWLLMPWLLTSPGHQQPWYWLCRICRSWSYLRKDFKYMCHINVE